MGGKSKGSYSTSQAAGASDEMKTFVPFFETRQAKADR